MMSQSHPRGLAVAVETFPPENGCVSAAFMERVKWIPLHDLYTGATRHRKYTYCAAEQTDCQVTAPVAHGLICWSSTKLRSSLNQKFQFSLDYIGVRTLKRHVSLIQPNHTACNILTYDGRSAKTARTQYLRSAPSRWPHWSETPERSPAGTRVRSNN